MTLLPELIELKDLIIPLITGLLTIIGYLTTRTLSSIDKNQSLLFEKYDTLRDDQTRTASALSKLLGEHEALHNRRATDG